MLKISKSSTVRRVGALCLIAFGMTVMSCQQQPVNPQASTGNRNVIPMNHTPADSVQLQDDQPPKDVGGGNGGK